MEPVDFVLPDLEGTLWNLLSQVPSGRVTTYGTLGEALGDRVAARWVGQVLLHHRCGHDCACHRVVRAGGALGGYVSGDVREKAERLAAEGVEVSGDRIDLGARGFERFECDRPLERLREIQNRVRDRAVFEPPREKPVLVAGVDVSYATGGEAWATYALLEAGDGASEPVWFHTVFRPAKFPYITSYLAFRELPILLDLIEEVRQEGPLADVILVDGSGVLHPRRAGIATMLGVALAHPTIGVTKKLLTGSVNLSGLRPGRARTVREQGEPLGVAMLPKSGTRRPLFVSPGYRVDVGFAREVVRSFLGSRRLPAPIYWADRLSRAAARKGSYAR